MPGKFRFSGGSPSQGGFRRIDVYLWNPDVVEKLAVKHNVETWEVEEVFEEAFEEQPFIRFREKGQRDGEHLYTALGQTSA